MIDKGKISWKDTLILRSIGILKVPLLWYIRPVVVEMNETRSIIKIPFKRRNQNHLGSLYFAVLCAGADVAGGLWSVIYVRRQKANLSLAFKDFKAEFLKRAHGDTYFVNDQSQEIMDFVDMVLESGERHTMPVTVKAICPDYSETEPVATFELGLSLKKKS